MREARRKEGGWGLRPRREGAEKQRLARASQAIRKAPGQASTFVERGPRAERERPPRSLPSSAPPREIPFRAEGLFLICGPGFGRSVEEFSALSP
jgi:hypothetical protein